ncbi:MAG: hypothetical protein Kow0029_20620 [Candidatus Rifleibacteriota bacterium]
MRIESSFIKHLTLVMLFLFAFNCFADDIDSMINQAKETLKAGNSKKAAEILNHLLVSLKTELRNHPRHAEVWYYFSIALDRLGKKELSEKALKRAKDLKSQMPHKQVEEKNESDRKAKENSTPDKPPASDDQTSITTFASNENEPADNVYTLKSLKNEKAKLAYRKGAAYLEQGQLQAAADQFLKAVELEGDNVELLAKTCEILDQAGENYYIKAQRLYADLARLNADKMTLQQKLGQARANIYSSKPDLKLAENILNEIIKSDEKNVEAIVLSAQIDSENMKFKSAVEKFEKAIKLDKANLQAYIGLGNCYLRMNKFDKAIEILSKARRIWPDSFKPLVALGKAYLKNENLGQALQMFNTAFAINPDSFDVNLGLLEIFARTNDSRASQHLEICERLYPGDPRVEYWKAIFYELDERLLQAKKIYTWLAMYDDEISYRARVRLGQLYSGKGHETFPGNLLVKNRPAYVANYRSLENYKLAYAYYQQVLDKNPDFREINDIKAWLNENEEKISAAIQFDSLIQSHFRQ